MVVMMMVVMKQLCTCRLRAGVVPGEGATVATAGTVLHVQLILRCDVSMFQLFQQSLWQQPAFHKGPTFTTNFHQLQQYYIEPSMMVVDDGPSSTTKAASHQSSRRHIFYCHHPAACWALTACLAQAQSLLLRMRG